MDSHPVYDSLFHHSSILIALPNCPEFGRLVIPGRNPLTFSRFYNAIGGASSKLGTGWTHSFNIALHDVHPNIYITFPDGHVERYQDVSYGTYVSPLGSKNELSKQEDTWILTSPDIPKRFPRRCDPRTGNLSAQDTDGGWVGSVRQNTVKHRVQPVLFST